MAAAEIDIAHITSQDLKLGVRFNFNALEPVRYEQRQVYAPAPVYTQPPVIYSPPPVVNSRG